MNRKTGLKRVLTVFIIFVAVICVSSIGTYTKKGVNGVQTKIRMPLYVKYINFLSRHYEYNRLAREVVGGARSDEEKALAILTWTKQSIKPVPQGMPVVDDHILNIIIRGYGSLDQAQDVFATICEYAGIPAFWEKVCSDDKRVKYVLSFARIDNRWCVFDAYRGVYCRNNNGNIASVEDILNNRFIFSDPEAQNVVIKGVPYMEFYRNIVPVHEKRGLRTDKQKPLNRFMFEIKKALNPNIEK